MTDDLRQRIADALTAAAHQCDGNCGLDERACYDAHPITWSAMAGGTTHIDGSVTAIADAVLALVQPELVRLRSELRNSERIRENADFHLGQEMARRQLAEKDVARLRAELNGLAHEHGREIGRAVEAEASIGRARALHQHNEDASYCDVCSNHGDLAWPCATIAALDGPETAK
uniref:hypothetical protein n=1 Tax=Streptomyces tubercidicus TaxID=47759 RepID=UPI0030E0A33E